MVNFSLIETGGGPQEYVQKSEIHCEKTGWQRVSLLLLAAMATMVAACLLTLRGAGTGSMSEMSTSADLDIVEEFSQSSWSHEKSSGVCMCGPDISDECKPSATHHIPHRKHGIQWCNAQCEGETTTGFQVLQTLGRCDCFTDKILGAVEIASAPKAVCLWSPASSMIVADNQQAVGESSTDDPEQDVVGWAAEVVGALTTIATLVGPAIIDAVRASQGQVPYWYTVWFDYQSEAKQLQWLRDGDCVTMQATFEPGVPKNAVKIRLISAPYITWWKAVTLHHGNQYIREVVSTQDGYHRHEAFLFAPDMAESFVLSKAKAFGVHTNMYLLQETQRMFVGFTYTFEWLYDR